MSSPFICKFLFKVLAVLFTQSLIAQSIQPIVQKGANGENISLWVDYNNKKPTIHSMIVKSNLSDNNLILLSSENRLVISQPLFVMNHAGQGVALWQSHDQKDANVYIEAAAYSSDLGWSSSQILSDETTIVEPSNYHLYLDESGILIVFWNILTSNILKQKTTINKVYEVDDFYK